MLVRLILKTNEVILRKITDLCRSVYLFGDFAQVHKTGVAIFIFAQVQSARGRLLVYLASGRMKKCHRMEM